MALDKRCIQCAQPIEGKEWAKCALSPSAVACRQCQVTDAHKTLHLIDGRTYYKQWDDDGYRTNARGERVPRSQLERVPGTKGILGRNDDGKMYVLWEAM